LLHCLFVCLLIRCSDQQPAEHQTEASRTVEPDLVSSTTTSNPTSSSQPNVYAEIEPRQQPTSGLGQNNQLYANIPAANNNAMGDSVLYSELQSNDIDDNHTVAPSGALYAEVQKR